jgi:N-acetylmuramoyl-L-alanine amidase
LVLLVGVAGLVLAVPRGAWAKVVAVEVSALAGGRLGALSGEQLGRVAYFPLDDVARLTGATARRWTGGERLTLVSRQGALELTRGAPYAVLDGRRIALAAPVRVHRGAWHVPGDLLIRALPALLGTAVRITPGAPAVAGPVVPGVARPPARTAVPAALRPAAASPVAPAVLAPPAHVGREGPPSRAPTGPPPPGPAPRTPAPASRPAPPAAGVELRYRSYPAYTRIVVETERPLEARVVETAKGLSVLFPDASPRGWRETRSVRDGLVGTVELGEVRGAAALVVGLEAAPAGRRVYRLDEPPRFVLELQRRAPGPVPAGGGPEPIRTVVLDPGHGGHDTGALGPTGLQEKGLTLDVARRVAALLREDQGVRVILTRTRDQFLPLRERTALANREKADLFVSVHANAAPTTAAIGAETYFLSTEATDSAARRAAEYENRVISLEAAGRGAGRDVLRAILWDLAQSDFQQESSRAAEAIQNQLDRALRLPSRGVKQAPFYVLGGAAMPAVLVEIGFLSNPHEEQRLRDDGYRERIARALAAGLAAYKRGYDQRVGAVARR